MDGVEFGRYRLIELLGRGGMGEVWRAFDNDTQRIVAVKVLPAHLADDPQFEQRFRREAYAAAGLANPHVVPIHSFGEIDGRLYVDMRLIEGRDLHQILTDGALPLPRAVSITEQIASALQSAHRVGLVHRDVKPSNVLVDEDDFAYLIDFGIARGIGQTSLTATSGVVGTWAYMAPERLSKDNTDARADVYALACVLHECLTGSQPFPANSLERQIAAHIAEPPPRPSLLQPTVPTSMDSVIAKGMAKDPDQRFQTVKELANAARAAAATYPIPTPAPHRPPEPHRPPPAPQRPPAPQPQPQRPAVEHSGPNPTYGLMPPAGPTQHAPTQYAQSQQPPSQYQPSQQPPSQYPPMDPYYRPSGPVPTTPPAGPPKKGNGRWIALAAAGVVVVIAVVAGVVLTQGDSKSGGGPGAAPTSTAAPNSGPLTGTFAVAMGPAINADGSPATDDADTAAFSATWQLRSACTGSNCVATASTGNQRPAKDLVFDNTGGRWLTVITSQRRCGKRDSVESWQAITFQPQPNGTMVGEWTDVTTSACFHKRTVTLTRTGDTNISQLPDPANLPARVVSPGEALHGRYDNAYTYASGTKYLDHLGVRTDCLRSGDRCMSYFVHLDTVNRGSAYIFSGGTWTRNTQFETQCGDGGKQIVQFTETMPLPQPPQDPIQLLNGHGNMDVQSGTGKCKSQGFDQTFTRVGE